MTTATRRAWREAREGRTWSKTRYRGLQLAVDTSQVLVSNLGKGLRAFLMQEPDYYQFEPALQDQIVLLPDESMLEICRAVHVDLLLQRFQPEYDLLVSADAKGFSLMMGEKQLAVCKLSHGLRVLVAEGYKITTEPKEVGAAFLETISLAFEADQLFQKWLPEYEAIMKTFP